MGRTAADWITLADAAALLGAANVRVRPATIGGWARRGDLQSVKIGGRRYVRRAEVRALVRPRRRVNILEIQPRLFEDLAR